jgi:hypothetical protein
LRNLGVEVVSGQVGGYKGLGLRQVEVYVGLCADLDGGLAEGEVVDVSAGAGPTPPAIPAKASAGG